MQKKIYNLVQSVLLTATIFVVLFLLASRFLPKFNYGMFIIQSGSMQPIIKIGSIIISQKQADYQKKDIITFAKSKKNIVTHRIVEIIGAGDETAYKTKGDANDSADISTVKKSFVLGKMVLTVPYLGYVIIFAKTKIGLLLLIIIPALWFIVEEILKIKKIISEKKKNETPA